MPCPNPKAARIKALSNRRPRPPGSTVQQPLPGGPFNTIDPNTVASSSASTPSVPSFDQFNPAGPALLASSSTPTPSNGFTFGLSQSFPGAGSTSSGNGSQVPAFGAGGSSSFNFPTSSGSSDFSNPFSHMNGASQNTNPAQNQPAASLGGFKGSLFNIPGLPAPNLAQSAQIVSQASQGSGSGLFATTSAGAPTSGASIFQSTPSTAGAAPFSFGKSAPQPSTTNLFGASTSNKPFVFGQPTNSVASSETPKTQNTLRASIGSDTMQTSPDGKTKTPPASGTLSSTTNNPFISQPSTPLFGASAPTTPSAPTTTASNSAFGQLTKPTESKGPPATSTTPPTSSTPASSTMPAGNSLFGRVTKPSEPQEAPATPSTPATSSMTTTSNTPAPSSMTAGNSFFGRVMKPSEPQEAPTTTASDDQSSKSTDAQSSTSAGEGKPVFGFGGSQASTSTKPPTFGASNPMFGQTQSMTTSPAPFKTSIGTPFGQASKAADTPAMPFFGQTPKPSDKTSTGPLFGQPSKVDQHQDSLSANPTTSQGTSNRLFDPVTKASTQNDVKTATSVSSTSFTPTNSAFGQTPKPAGSSQPQTLVPSGPQIGKQSSGQPFSQPGTQSQPFSPFASSSKNTATLGQQTPFDASSQKSAMLKSPTKAPATPVAGTKSGGIPFMKVPEPPADLDDEQKSDFRKQWMLRLLNECFQRKINEINTESEGLDSVVMFYLNVREAINIPLGSMMSKPRKRKEQNEDHNQANAPQSAKKTKASDSITKNAKTSAAPSAEALPSSSSINSKASLFPPPAAGPSITPSNTSSKRKASDDTDTVNDVNAQSGKRAKNSTEPQSSTASIFANSFSASNGPGEAGSVMKPSNSSLFGMKAPKVPDFKVNAKPTPSKSAFNGPSSSSSTIQRIEWPSKPVFQPPKFGNSNGTNFLAQFGKHAAKEADKEKAKRKADDFDSDEDDEAEWERKDSEAQAKKQKLIDEQSKKRAQFVPGKGFVFADDAEKAETAEPAAPAAPQPAASFSQQTDPASSVFDKQGGAPPATSDNPFGHLSSANPSDGDESSDEDDFVTAHLKAKQRRATQEAEAAQRKEAEAEEPKSNGRSLFDRIQYGNDGKPLRDSSASDDDNNASKAAGTPKNRPSSLFQPETPSALLSTPFNTPSSAFAGTPSSSSGKSITFGGTYDSSDISPEGG
jgi:hypothetical protein